MNARWPTTGALCCKHDINHVCNYFQHELVIPTFTSDCINNPSLRTSVIKYQYGPFFQRDKRPAQMFAFLTTEDSWSISSSDEILHCPPDKVNGSPSVSLSCGSKLMLRLLVYAVTTVSNQSPQALHRRHREVAAH